MFTFKLNAVKEITSHQMVMVMFGALFLIVLFFSVKMVMSEIGGV